MAIFSNEKSNSNSSFLTLEITNLRTTGTIKQRQFRMTKEFFNFFFEKSKNFKKKSKKYSRIISREKRRSSRFSRNIVAVFVYQSFMWRCSRSFRCSRSKRLKRVVPQRQQRTVFWANWRGVCANECIYFLAVNIYILLSNGREANLSKLSFLS